MMNMNRRLLVSTNRGIFFFFFVVLILSSFVITSVSAGGTNEEGLAFLAENKEKPGVITLESGLQYKVLKKGKGPAHPTVDSPCLCHYEGKLINGNVFDSSYERGDPTTFAPNQVIKGKSVCCRYPNIRRYPLLSVLCVCLPFIFIVTTTIAFFEEDPYDQVRCMVFTFYCHEFGLHSRLDRSFSNLMTLFFVLD